MKRRNWQAQGFLWIGLTISLAAMMTLAPSQSGAQAELPERQTSPVVARRLTVTGRGEVKVQPDKADITIDPDQSG